MLNPTLRIHRNYHKYKYWKHKIHFKRNQEKRLEKIFKGKKIYIVPKDKIHRLFDKSIYIVVFVAPLLNIPQAYSIYKAKEATGVSAFSWLGFTGMSMIRATYGYLRNDKPIFIMNLSFMVIQGCIAIGAIIY